MANDRDLALRYLGDCLYGALLGQAGAVRPSDLVRSLPRGVRVGVGLIRQLLVDDERFEEMAGRFELSARDSLRKKPFGGAVTGILEAAERPVPISLMTTALGRIRGASPQYFHELLDDYEQSRDEIVYAAGHVVHSDWLLLMEGDTDHHLLFYNRLDDDEDLKTARELCETNDLRRRDPGLTAAAILGAVGHPLAPRALAFLTWLHHPQIFDPVVFVRQVLEREDIIAAAGMWMGADYVERLHEELRAASDELSGEGEDMPEVDIEEVLAKEAPATPFKLADADRSNILAVVGSVQAPIGIEELVIDILEIRPEQRRFVAAAHVLDRLLSDQPDLMRVSTGRYLSRAAVPDWVREIPQPLIPVETDFEEDALLEVDALPEALRQEVLDPVYEDVFAGVEITPEETMVEEDHAECLLLHHHYVVGTLPVRSIDRKLFSSETDLRLLLMRHGDSEVYPVWLNSRLGLLFGLARWYHRYLPPSGAVFSVTREDGRDSFVLEYGGRTEAELCPEEDRMAVLERRRERVSRRPISIRYLMIELLRDHEGGLSFNGLWAEMNVVRRTSRRQIASLLALYPCFFEESGRWKLNPDAIDEPIDDRYADSLVEPVMQSEQEPAGNGRE
jgi:hypothetical protein